MPAPTHPRPTSSRWPGADDGELEPPSEEVPQESPDQSPDQDPEQDPDQILQDPGLLDSGNSSHRADGVDGVATGEGARDAPSDDAGGAPPHEDIGSGDDNPFVEPANLPSNVVGGYGVVGGLTLASVDFEPSGSARLGVAQR